MKQTEISNTQDTIDSRDIQERIDYLEALGEDEEDIDEDEKEELEKLQAFKEEADASEWDFGVAFIHEDYFEDYAREFAEDIGAIGKDTQWPATHIDWDAAANELQMDYSSAKFDGVTYYFR